MGNESKFCVIKGNKLLIYVFITDNKAEIAQSV